MDLIWGHISPEPMRCPECENIGLNLWPIQKTSFWFSGHVSKKIIRKKRQHVNVNEELRWMNEFVDIEKRHEEYWGSVETKRDGKDNGDGSCDDEYIEYNPM